MNCIIIDDEPLAVKVIEKHLSMVTGYIVAATFDSALPVYKYLQNNKVDLIFLDIEMPNLSGLNFLKSLAHHPKIIITTAHREYALDSYDFLIADYLVKPISFERFLKAISKLDIQQSQNFSSIGLNQHIEKNGESNYTFFTVDRRNIRVNFNEILYIESIKNHVKIVLDEINYITHLNLHEVERKIDQNNFIRIHKSFIVSIQNIKSFSNTNVQVHNRMIPIGRSYKLNVLEVLNKLIL